MPVKKKSAKKGVSAKSLAVKGTAVKGKAGKRTKVVSLEDANLKQLLKRAEALSAGSAKLVKATGGRPKTKAVKAKRPVAKKVAVNKSKGVKAKGISLLKKRLTRIKKVAG